MAASQLVCCDLCGSDTKNKSRICKRCNCGSGASHDQVHASSVMGPWSLWENEDETFDGDEFGPKQAEDRLGALWVDEDSEWRKKD